MLNNAWQHIEALQTSDLLGIIEYISDIIIGSLESRDVLLTYAKNNDLHQRQEVMVFYYLDSIIAKIDDFTESR